MKKHLLFALFLFLLHNAIPHHYFHSSLIDNYLDDVLLLPIVLGIALFIQRKYISKNPSFSLHKAVVIASWAYFCIVFELIIPRFTKNFTADWLDCVAYAIGALYFYIWMNNAKGTGKKQALPNL